MSASPSYHPARSGGKVPTVGHTVWYQTDGRNGLHYYLPAIVTVTQDTHPGDYPDGKPNSLPVPDADNAEVHLTVLTPGGFGSTFVVLEDGGEVAAERTYDNKDVNQQDMENLGRPESFMPGSGGYVEWSVPFDADGSPRSWRWPEVV